MQYQCFKNWQHFFILMGLCLLGKFVMQSRVMGRIVACVFSTHLQEECCNVNELNFLGAFASDRSMSST